MNAHEIGGEVEDTINQLLRALPHTELERMLIREPPKGYDEFATLVKARFVARLLRRN